jgi:hypothetical protein
MTEQPPATPESSTPPAAESPTAPPPEPTAGRSIKGLVIAGIAVVVVLALAGGAFAVYKKLDGGGAQPHDVLPASVIAYARVDVDPSASQKIALFKLIRKFPDAADEIGIENADQDVRKLLFDEILKQGDCDLTYDKDVEPWLGSRIGLGLDEDQAPLAAIQVSDEKNAEDGIKALFECGDEKASVAFLDGYAIVAENQKKADAAVKAAEKAPLADKKAFVADFDDLGEQGVASAWVDTSKLVEAFPEFKDAMADASAADLKEFEQAGTAAIALRTDGSTLELAGLSGLTDSVDKMTPAPLGKLPADTVAALSIGGFGDQIAAQYDTLLQQFKQGFEGGLNDPSNTEGMTAEEKDFYEEYFEENPIEAPDPEDYIAEFEQQTGLKVPGDLETLFGGGLTFAVGSKNLETLPTLSGPADVAALDVALQMTTDPDKAIDLAERLATLATQVGVDLSTTKTDDGAVIATNQDAADALDTSGSLGKDDTFRSVMPYGDDTLYGMFVDVGTILDKLSEAGPPDDVAKGIEEAKALKAVGVSYGKKGDHTVFSLRVAFAK